jgi:hypothetical protein
MGAEEPLARCRKTSDLMTRDEMYQTSTGRLIRRCKAQIYDGNVTVMCTRQERMMALKRRDFADASTNFSIWTELGHVLALRASAVR